MKIKSLITGLLILFVVISAAYLVFDSYKTIKKSPVNNENTDLPASAIQKIIGKELPHNIIIAYFHTTFRCNSCQKIEALTKEAMQKGFPKELKKGKLVWKTVNIDEQGNSRFIEDYNLATKSVIVIEVKDNKQIQWKNLQKVWELLNDDKAFLKYIQDEVKSYLEKA